MREVDNKSNCSIEQRTIGICKVDYICNSQMPIELRVYFKIPLEFMFDFGMVSLSCILKQKYVFLACFKVIRFT